MVRFAKAPNTARMEETHMKNAKTIPLLMTGVLTAALLAAPTAQAADIPPQPPAPYTISVDHWSREDFSQEANPAVFTDVYDRELYNAIRQTLVDGGPGDLPAYTMVSKENYSAVKNLTGRLEGVLRHEHYVPQNFTNYWQYLDYYTRTMYVSSATSTWIDGYTTKVYSTDAPSGTIFTSEDGAPLETVQENGATCYVVDTSKTRTTNLNSNGSEYYGAFKVCIPVDNAADEGSFTIKATGGVAQYNLFLAYNPSASEQSYIVADPGYTTLEASATFKWSGTEEADTASLQVVKVGAGGEPLEGAAFTLSGSGGTTVTGTSDRNGQVVWTNLPADETFTLSETSAPEGYQIIDPINITLTAGRTSYMTIRDDTDKTFKVKKIDAQNKAVLQGAVFVFEQIDGSYKTTGTTGFDGIISFAGDELPYGSYRVSEQSSPEGYQKDTRVETVEWTGKEDVTLTFENVRDVGLTIVKKDGETGVCLPGATFDVYADGELITSVTTNDAGEAYVTGIQKEAYIEVVETVAPAGYVLDQTPHGIHIDPYDPAIEDDPVLTVTNQNKAALRIIKYDQQSGSRLAGVTFEIYKDAALFDTQTTDGNGEIFLYDLEPGTYLVQEVSTDDDHVVTSTPQQIELEAGQTGTQTLIFFNQLKPGIHLVKVDSITMKSLPNVRFEFKLVGGSYRQEFTTDINGEIDLSKLAPGAYEVRELEAPDGYLIDDAVRVVQINPDENATGDQPVGNDRVRQAHPAAQNRILIRALEALSLEGASISYTL